MPALARANQTVDAQEPFRLRTFLEDLAREDELKIVSDPTSLVQIAEILEGTDKAVLFERPGASALPLVGNVMGSRKRMAHAFGVDPKELLTEIQRRLRQPQTIVEVGAAGAPVQEVIARGDDADLTTLPVHLQHAFDGGLYISAGMDFCQDRVSGWTNVGLRRFMLRGRRQTGIDLLAPSDLRAIYLASLARGEKLPVSVVVGAHPVDYLAATMRLPVDELALIATLRGETLRAVKCVTNDLRVPADAELVIEGYLGAEGYAEAEGPYGEFLGYYGAVKTNPVFHVTAITRRRDAVFQTLSISGAAMARTDTAQLCSLRTEVLAWRALETAIREPVAVYAPAATGGVYNVRISMRQRVPGEARNAIAAAFASQANIKNVFVVDPDVDIFSDDQMEWALGTRFQPTRDLVVEDGFRTLPLDPSLQGKTTGSKAGYDLTFPLGPVNIERQVPAVPAFSGTQHPSVHDALKDGPKTFEQLMTSVASPDGFDVVLELERLHAMGVLKRNESNGCYGLE